MDEKFEHLTELIRRVSDALSPHDKDDFSWLKDKGIVDKMYGKHPKCFAKIKGMGQDIPFLPICNRMGIEDPNTIQFSIRVAEKMRGNPKFNEDDVNALLIRLNRTYVRFNKDIPTPPSEATRKGVQTKKFNKVKSYIDKLKG